MVDSSWDGRTDVPFQLPDGTEGRMYRFALKRRSKDAEEIKPADWKDPRQCGHQDLSGFEGTMTNLEATVKERNLKGRYTFYFL